MRELEDLFEKTRELDLIKSEKYIQKRIQETSCSLSDIVNFVQEKLDQPWQDFRIGYELSMLINTRITENDKVVLKTEPEYPDRHHHRYETNKISGLGYKLKKGRFEITGHPGYETARGQEGGIIIVKENAGVGLCSYKKGGLTIVNGNAESYACNQMEGGVTKVQGSTGKDTCSRMKGGLLVVEGKIKHIGKGSFYKEWVGGIVVEKNVVRRWELEGWDINTILPLDKYLPKRNIMTILGAYAEKNGCKNLKQLVENREPEYIVRLRRLDQELPAIIRKIDEPQEKLLALKALEQVASENQEKEVIQLAQKCTANTQRAEEKYNQEIKQQIKKRKQEIRELRKKLF